MGSVAYIPTPNTPVTPRPLKKIGGSSITNPLNYGATLDMHCEVIVVANAQKYSVDLHYVCRQKNLLSTLAALVPQFVGLSCYFI